MAILLCQKGHCKRMCGTRRVTKEFRVLTEDRMKVQLNKESERKVKILKK